MLLFAASGLTDLKIVTGQRIRSLSAAGAVLAIALRAAKPMQGSLGVMDHLSSADRCDLTDSRPSNLRRTDIHCAAVF
jgi:hypothetical protein